MDNNDIKVVCPEAFPDVVWNEAEVLGSMTWLWHHDMERREASLVQSFSYILPPIKLRQFIMFYDQGNPIGYMSWANFDEISEDRYLNSQDLLTLNDWSSGDRTWIIDFFAPFGHYLTFIKIIKELLPTFDAKGVSRHNKTRRVYSYKGNAHS